MFSDLNRFSKYLHPNKVSVQDFVFTLHYRVTFAFLLIAGLLLSLNQFFGDPIECRGGVDTYRKWEEQYCWTHGTYIFNYNYEKKNANPQDLVGHGIKPKMYHSVDNLRSKYEPKSEDRVYLRYYQWVVLILTIQAVTFAFPGFLWRIWEKRRLQKLLDQLDDLIYDIDDEKHKYQVQMLRKYFTTSGVNDINFRYALKYGFCELLNFTICILNVILMNIFFMNFWSNYASVLSTIPLYDWNEWNYYSSKLFPKIVKCDIHIFGASGTVEKRDLLCLLPLNILNEKIFAFFYLWFLCLTILSGLNILFRISLLAFKSFRIHLLKAQARFLNTNEISIVLSNLNYGDWYLLYKISCNINPLLFKELWLELKSFGKNGFNKVEI